MLLTLVRGHQHSQMASNIFLLVMHLFLVGAANARSVADIKLFFMKQAVECNSQYPITAEEMQSLKDHKIPDTDNAKCLINCVFKKIKWMDPKGNFDADSAFNMIKDDHLEEPPKLEGSKKLMDFCKKVNDEATSDGEKGCERAVSLTKCLLENAATFGLAVQ